MINTVTLNPALDLILYLGSFRRNITNRTDAPTVTMGGKGTHVSMDLQLMGVPSRAYGFGYGGSGKRIMQMLEQSGVQARFVYDAAHGESRSNYLRPEFEGIDNENWLCNILCRKGADGAMELSKYELRQA